MEIQFKKIHPNASVPKQATELAGGWDVVVTEIEEVDVNFVICKLGFALGLPEGYKLTLVPRSSLTKTNWIVQNSPGLGDADYMNEYQFRFRAIPIGYMDAGKFFYEAFPFKVGDRVGQVYLEEVIPMEFIEVDELTPKGNREGGFGSTDKKE